MCTVAELRLLARLVEHEQYVFDAAYIVYVATGWDMADCLIWAGDIKYPRVTPQDED